MLDNQRLQQLMIIHPKGNDYQGATEILFTELQRLATEPVTQEELDSAKQAMLKNSACKPLQSNVIVMNI